MKKAQLFNVIITGLVILFFILTAVKMGWWTISRMLWVLILPTILVVGYFFTILNITLKERESTNKENIYSIVGGVISLLFLLTSTLSYLVLSSCRDNQLCSLFAGLGVMSMMGVATGVLLITYLVLFFLQSIYYSKIENGQFNENSKKPNFVKWFFTNLIMYVSFFIILLIMMLFSSPNDALPSTVLLVWPVFFLVFFSYYYYFKEETRIAE